MTLNAAQANIARALGPAAAGVLLARYGPAAAFGANAATNVVMLTALATIRPARRRSALVDDTVLGRVLAGARYTRRHAGLALSVLLAALVSFVGTPVVQLAPVFAREVFHVGDLGYGVLVSGLGIGACIGTVLVSAYGQHTCRSRIAMVAVVVHAVAALALGAAPSFLVAVGATVVLGVSYLAVVSAANATIQLLVADEYRGRVVSLYWMAFAGAYPLGAVAQGFVADVAGPRIAVAAAGVLLLAVLAVVARGGALGALDEPATRPAPSPARVGRAR